MPASVSTLHAKVFLGQSLTAVMCNSQENNASMANSASKIAKLLKYLRLDEAMKMMLEKHSNIT